MTGLVETVTEDGLSLDVIKELMPRRTSRESLESMQRTINGIISESEPEFRLNFRDNLIGYSNVMKEGKYKITDYLNAVKFASHRLAGHTFKDCYIKTFPERYARLKEDGVDDFSSYVSAYTKNKMVVSILEQAMIPVSLLNADIYQKAINVQAAIMMDEDVSPMVRTKAADSLLNHLKPAEETKMTLDISATAAASDALSELRQLTETLAKQQRGMIIEGKASVHDISDAVLVTSSLEDDDD